jgi:hypothetical protein
MEKSSTPFRPACLDSVLDPLPILPSRIVRRISNSEHIGLEHRQADRKCSLITGQSGSHPFRPLLCRREFEKA